MQLRIQRKGGVFGGKIYFALDVRAEYSAEEKADINKYEIGGEVVYNSQAAKRHLDAMGQKLDDGGFKGIAGAFGSLALAKMNLNITIASLARGHHIECKDLGELADAEQALYTACKNLRANLKLAASFDGSEVVIDFKDEEPTVVPAQPVQLERAVEMGQAMPEPRSGLTADRGDSILSS